ncbi:ATP-binding cassette domain-containing protein [Empedobacter stercoris]|uniref:AAA family ATPase n=1 Tax=Empedobacter stercoris TaxID=1628248 RepID=UPI0016627F5A|nr:ATP-binding cassette domain-containing protein [Empedobacter stercoris]MCA4810597.1 ATP-binding cassette domain-containing protein [Empedobacter stercoris]QNT13402.1 ATP-binding cassette domain-containing protein [Empedobacter stercoris]
MHRITKIELENCRAYYKNYVINLERGQNLIIYGENGSGKSSLFKSFNQFFENSINQQIFTKNIFNNSINGKIELTFSEFDEYSKIINSNNLKFSNSGSNNNVAFIKEASLISGFLDYTDLLKIYLKSEPNPNLFDLIFNILLSEYIPTQAGNSNSFKSQYDFLIKNLITDAKTRRSRCHQLALTKISAYKSSLILTLDSIFELVNNYLSKYFKLTDLRIEYILKDVKFEYAPGGKSNWFLDTDLRLKILKNGQNLGDDYKDFLNEARLSSFAICLYLASLKLTPNQDVYKLIYFDDIFIGLDTANRIPILKILKDEFIDWQIFISSYDKGFFEVCNNFFADNRDHWKSIEIYVGSENLYNGSLIDIPIVVENKTDLDKARFYLYNNENPDYPAAANYFRKYLEDTLLKIFPKELFRTSDLEQIEGYKLTKIFRICNDFVEKNLVAYKTDFYSLNAYLFILLHPLSHYNKTLNTFKNDLKDVDRLISNLLENQLFIESLKSFKFIGRNIRIKLDFQINQYSSVYYEFIIKDSLFFNDNCSNKVPLVCVKYYSTINKRNIEPKKLNYSNSNIRYNSIEEAYSGISVLIKKRYRFYEVTENILNKISIEKDGIFTAIQNF